MGTRAPYDIFDGLGRDRTVERIIEVALGAAYGQLDVGGRRVALKRFTNRRLQSANIDWHCFLPPSGWLR